ncbi:hypothetical protein AMTRI_Chr11g155740 [Amborella trichopoda]
MDHDRVSVITFIIFGVSSAFPDRLSPFATMEQSPSPENRDYLAASLWTVWKERNYRTSVLKGFSEFIKKILLADMQPVARLNYKWVIKSSVWHPPQSDSDWF